MTFADGKIDLFCENGIWLETLRQWLILVFSLALIIVFIRAIFHLMRTHRKFTFDVLVLSSETLKVFI